MSSRALLLLTVSMLFCQPIDASFWHKLAVVAEGSCAAQNVKLLSLLNLLCNTTQTTSIQMRDACYGCFFRAAGSTMSGGPTQLSSLNDCARLYIAETSKYTTCARSLQTIVDGNRQKLSDSMTATASFCYTGYCAFVRCVRRINAQQLISSCYVESLGTRPLTEELDRITFYTNITACILARTRCAQYNPISGELQYSTASGTNAAAAAAATPGWIGGGSGLLSAVQPLYFNALQISESDEIRVISFPIASTSVSDLFCSRLPTLQQARFSTYNC